MGRFHGAVKHRPMGDASVIWAECDPCRGRRGASEIASTTQASIGVLFILDGREKLSHPNHDAFVEAGQFTLWDTTRPLRFAVPERLRKLTLMLPTKLIAPTLRTLPRWRRVFDARQGCGALLSAQLRTLAGMPEGLDATSQQVALRSTLELLMAAISVQSGVSSSPSARIVARARAHITRHLSEPDLNVESTARALGLSRRQLDRAFAEGGQSASRLIWSMRLERCRRDLLLEPRSTISEIAFRWGFSDAAHFSRAFRAAFAMSPSQYRRPRP